MNALRTVLSARLVLILLGLFALTSQVQAEIIIQGLDNPKSTVLDAKLDALFQGYFKAVAAGDNEKAVTGYYPWQTIRASDMPKRFDDAMLWATFIKQQMDANKGFKSVKVLRVDTLYGRSIDEIRENTTEAKVIFQIEFNNGYKDISGVVSVTREYDKNPGPTDEWKMGSKASGVTTFSFPIVGIQEVLKIAENYHAAVLAGDISSMKKMHYIHGTNTWDAHLDTLAERASSFKRVVQLNGGIKNIVVENAANSSSKIRGTYKEGDLASITVGYDIHYGNGKKEYKQSTFLWDKDQWKVSNI